MKTSYFSNEMLAQQEQDGVVNKYLLDSMGRPRQLDQSEEVEEEVESKIEVFHYAGPSDTPAWTQRASDWTRSVVGINGELTATQDSAAGLTFQLTNLHGDVVATASSEVSATALLAKFEFDEFGNPKQGEAGRYGWLGGKTRRTELSSGVIQMGVRSYVPTVGRFLSVDPISGGSSTAYDYANADPVNSLDLNGERATHLGKARKAAGGRITRVGTSSPATVSGPATATASSSTIGSILRSVKEAIGIVAPIAWGTCIPSYEMSVKVSVLTKIFGNACIPKLGYDVRSVYDFSAAKILGATWCLAINGYLKTGTPVSSLLAPITAGSFCRGNDGERAWAYVRTY